MNTMEKLAGHLPAMKVGGRRRRSHTESSISLVKAHLQEKSENPNRTHHELDVEWEDEKEPELDHEKIRKEEFINKMKNTRLNTREPQHNYQRGFAKRNNIQQPMKGMLAI